MASLQARTCFVELLLPDYPNIHSLAGGWARHLATLLHQALLPHKRCSVGFFWLLVAKRAGSAAAAKCLPSWSHLYPPVWWPACPAVDHTCLAAACPPADGLAEAMAASEGFQLA